MKLESVRESNSLSRWELYVKSGIRTAKIGLIEEGHRVATERDKSVLSKALGVPVDTIEWPTGENKGKWRWR